jgi:RimJ/RimL family protein N-acetyltransferase
VTPLDAPVDLEGTGLVLRRLTEADGAAFAAAMAADHAHAAEHLPWPDVTKDPDGAAAWIGRYERGVEGRVLVAGIFDGDAVVGCAALISHDPAQASAEVGVWVTAAVQGRGAAAAACRALIAVARRELGAERVAWQCTSGNERSRRLAERLGFTHEGTLRSSTVLRGERHDAEVYSLVGGEIDRAITRSAAR